MGDDLCFPWDRPCLLCAYTSSFHYKKTQVLTLNIINVRYIIGMSSSPSIKKLAGLELGNYRTLTDTLWNYGLLGFSLVSPHNPLELLNYKQYNWGKGVFWMWCKFKGKVNTTYTMYAKTRTWAYCRKISWSIETARSGAKQEWFLGSIYSVMLIAYYDDP